MENHPQSKDGLPRRQAALAMRAQIDSAMPKLHDGVLKGADYLTTAGLPEVQQVIGQVLDDLRPAGTDEFSAQISAHDPSSLL